MPSTCGPCCSRNMCALPLLVCHARTPPSHTHTQLHTSQIELPGSHDDRDHTSVANTLSQHIHMYIYIHIHQLTDLHLLGHHLCTDKTYTLPYDIYIHHNYFTHAPLAYIPNIPDWSPALQPPSLLVVSATIVVVAAVVAVRVAIACLNFALIRNRISQIASATATVATRRCCYNRGRSRRRRGCCRHCMPQLRLDSQQKLSSKASPAPASLLSPFS